MAKLFSKWNDSDEIKQEMFWAAYKRGQDDRHNGVLSNELDYVNEWHEDGSPRNTMEYFAYNKGYRNANGGIIPK